VNRLNQVERTAVDLQGAVASYGAQIAQARARIAEIRQSGLPDGSGYAQSGG
jgi:HlyD family secretion protein